MGTTKALPQAHASAGASERKRWCRRSPLPPKKIVAEKEIAGGRGGRISTAERQKTVGPIEILCARIRKRGFEGETRCQPA